jgi:hypothetical protein
MELLQLAGLGLFSTGSLLFSVYDDELPRIWVRLHYGRGCWSALFDYRPSTNSRDKLNINRLHR